MEMEKEENVAVENARSELLNCVVGIEKRYSVVVDSVRFVRHEVSRKVEKAILKYEEKK